MIGLKVAIKHYSLMAKLVCARLMAGFCNGDDTWLIAEKPDEARDNGYWFAKYMCDHYPDKKIYYVIAESSADYHKIAALKSCRAVVPGSWKHRILFWSARYNVMSQPPCDYFAGMRKLLGLRKAGQINVFLQHGIIKDDLDHSLDADRAGIDIFITSAKREREAVMRRHGYREDQCVLTGLCRFDNLVRRQIQSKTILVMPTFRHWIMCADKGGIPSDDEISRFRNDDFFIRYNSLLTSPRLYELLEKYGYKLIFYPHYCAQPFLGVFAGGIDNENVILASSKKYDVQSLLLEADILITDYSSVFFDFAYLKKPEVFFQFDQEKFRGTHYKEGYFKYERDGFGPVFRDEDEIICYLDMLIKNKCVMEDKYLRRVNDFFSHTDSGNCQRTYETIVNYNRVRRP